MANEFEIRHVLDTPPEGFWERVHRSPDFSRYLYVDALGFEYEPLEVDHRSGVSRARIVPKVPAPDAVVKLLGLGFSFVEDGVLDEGDGVYRFQIIPSSLTDRVSVHGQMHILPEEGEKCVRFMRFQVEVRVPGLGGLVEKFVERATRQSYDDSARITNRFLAERAPSA